MRGFVLAGTGSGVGKTSIATGLMARLSKTMKVQPFKCGPDFIDPMYHTAATGRQSRNLDSFLMDDDVIRNVVGNASLDADICVVEGVRGLHEGRNGDDDLGSTAYISKLLGFPVILVVDARSLTRSATAIVNGFRSLDPDVDIAGVIMNNVSGHQHSEKLETAMERYCPDVQLIGMIPRNPGKALEQRYLGLRTLSTSDTGGVASLQELTECLDLDRVMDIMESVDSELPTSSPHVERDCGLKAAVPMDDAYCFYYRDNIECLRASGFSIEIFRPTEGDSLPDADLYYIGGGYPELHTEDISRNADFLEGLSNASSEGRMVIGECGGLMTMCSSITDKNGEVHRMSGIFDAEARMTGIRHGPTYVIADANVDNPAFSGTVRGHEYHYSDVFPASNAVYGFDMKRGQGIRDKHDGLVKRLSIGSYMHQHALSTDDWAAPMIEALMNRRSA